MIENRRIFLTGGAGFIGTALIGRLIEKNEIAVFDSMRRNALDRSPHRNKSGLMVVEGDVTDSTALASALKEFRPNIVVHLAAIAGIDTVIKSPTSTMRVNLLGTINALEAARVLSDLHRFVDFSTSEVFGTSAFRASEAGSASIGAVGEARWVYAVSKLAGEHLTHAYHREFGMPTVTLRPFNVYGPGQVGEGALQTFVLRALRNQELEIHGDGAQIRAWCYVEDMVDATLLAMEEPKAIGKSFNIGNARAVVTVYGLANTVVRVLGSSSRIRFVPRHSADIELRVPDVSKAREVLGFEAQVDLEEGLIRTAEFYARDL
ncbi:MAG: NAD-dependent epimerase/dehydratase family protein [Thermoanaerobaculia bacterium]|nr:NAD-dependent epimerase/dehydratase family protein [Thermoanaerobaculia bacterium]